MDLNKKFRAHSTKRQNSDPFSEPVTDKGSQKIGKCYD